MGKIEKLTSGTTGGPVFVYVQDGRIIRITPMDLDASDAASWMINARGKNFSPPRRTTIAPYSLAWRSMFYSPGLSCNIFIIKVKKVRSLSVQEEVKPMSSNQEPK